MNWKAYLMVPLLVVLSACGHLRSDPKTEAPNPAPPVVLETIEQPPLISQKNEKIILSDAETAAAEVAPRPIENVAPIDLFDRMRAGFKFPALESQHVSQYERWDTEHPTYLNNLFLRATPFLYHIVEELEKRDMPMEIALLPAIESAYKPEAVSRSNAGGLWQFIPSTGKYFGLHNDWWYDGRRDALASTTAALDYLMQLNKMFDGDWFLTLAAYNAGPGTVMRAIKKNKANGRSTNYSNLRLRSETKRYVPKLIALKNIIQNPSRFNIVLPTIASQPYFEVVSLPGQIDLKKFAADTQLDLSMLRHLNAGFKRWATSPDGPHRLLIPIGNGELVAKAQAAVKQAPQISFRNHPINQGDTLSSIANRYGVSIAALKKTNNLRGSQIRAGRNLLIPVSGSVTNTNHSSNTNKLVHKVQRGDTLWSIARRYKVQLQELLSWNNISSDQILRLNQSLTVMTNAVY